MHIPEDITGRSDYQACVRFHGHTCLGLTIGYLAATCALDRLGVQRAEDEELIAIVENDACCCDAIQVLTGCTFGKGNFFFEDHGKMAFTFGSRVQNRAIRLLLKPEVMAAPEEESALAEKIRSGQASAAERQRYEALSAARLKDLFAAGPESFFEIQESAGPLPPAATMAPSLPCDSCGEMVMETKLRTVGGRNLCRRCTPGAAS